MLEAQPDDHGLVQVRAVRGRNAALVRALVDGGFTLTHLRQTSDDLDEIYSKYFEKAGERDAGGEGGKRNHDRKGA